MSTLVETPVFTASVIIPDPGQPVLAADVETAVGPVANRTQYLDGSKADLAGNFRNVNVLVSSRSAGPPGNEHAYMILTASGSPAAETTVATASGNYHWNRLTMPIGAVLDSVTIRTFGTSGEAAGTLNLPTYQIVKWSDGAAPTNVSGVVNDVHTQPGWPSALDTTITPTSPETVDDSNYALVITHPWNAAVPAAMHVYEVYATCSSPV